MTKREALRQVAAHVAGLLSAGTFEEATGSLEWDVSDKDVDRLEWAVEEVIRRLYNIAAPRSERA